MRAPVVGDYVLADLSGAVVSVAYVCRTAAEARVQNGLVGMRWIPINEFARSYSEASRGDTWCLSGGEEEAAFRAAMALR